MKVQEKSPNQEFTMFETYMSDIFWQGWEDSLTEEQINWHWNEFWNFISSTKKLTH